MLQLPQHKSVKLVNSTRKYQLQKKDKLLEKKSNTLIMLTYNTNAPQILCGGRDREVSVEYNFPTNDLPSDINELMESQFSTKKEMDCF